MAKFDLKMKARELRRKGNAINRIAKLLNVSKSSVSIWCRDIQLTPEQIEVLNTDKLSTGYRGRLLGTQMNKNKKIAEIAKSVEWAKRIWNTKEHRDLFMAGIALYWAEGSKKGEGRFVFVNSDPGMIKLMCRWLTVIMKIEKSSFRPTVAINIIHQPRINVVLKFWSELLELPIENFNNTFFNKIPPKKIYENHSEYWGVLRLTVVKSTYLRYKILCLIDIMKRMPV